MVVCRELNGRDPGPEITKAKVGDVVIGWTQVKGESGEERLTHRWRRGDSLSSDVSLVIKSSPYRTWSKKTLTDPGSWTFQVLDSRGTILEEKTLTVTS